MGAENRAVTPFDLPTQPTLEDLLRVIVRQAKLGIRTHVPASVVAFDPATVTATVQVGVLPVVRVTDPTRIPAQMVALKGTPPNAVAVLSPIQLSMIPVFVYGTDTSYVSVPLLPGTTGHLEVFDRSLVKWMQTGIPDDPVMAFTHALADSMFVPGLRPKTKPIALPVDLTGVVIEGTQVKIGRNAVSSITKAEQLVTALVNAVNASAVGSMDGGATFKLNLATQLGLILSQIAATKGKVE